MSQTVLSLFLVVVVSGGWTPLAPMPRPRSLHVFIHGCDPATFFAIGGLRDGDDPDPWDVVDVYSVQNNSWSTLNDSLKLGRFSFAAATFGSFVYVFGGMTDGGAVFDIEDSVEAYDCEKSLWGAGVKLPRPLGGASAVAVPGGKAPAGIIIAGGWFSYEESSSRVFYFDGRTYRDLPPLSIARGLGTLIYTNVIPPTLCALGGSQTWDEGALAIVEVCDWDTGCTWKNAPAMPLARKVAAGGIIDAIQFAIGGVDSGNNYLDSVHTLNISSGAGWQKGPVLPKPLAGSAAMSFALQIYLCGGAQSTKSDFEVSLLVLEI